MTLWHVLVPIWGSADSHKAIILQKSLSDDAGQMFAPRVMGSNPGPYRVDFGKEPDWQLGEE